MLKIFKKAFLIVCEDIMFSPGVSNTHSAIAEFCDDNKYAYDFTGDDEVVIEGIVHEISCARSVFHRGRYVIKCREK